MTNTIVPTNLTRVLYGGLDGRGRTVTLTIARTLFADLQAPLVMSRTDSEQEQEALPANFVTYVQRTLKSCHSFSWLAATSNPDAGTLAIDIGFGEMPRSTYTYGLEVHYAIQLLPLLWGDEAPLGYIIRDGKLEDYDPKLSVDTKELNEALNQALLAWLKGAAPSAG